MRNEDLSYFESEEFKEALTRYETAIEQGLAVYMDADELTDISEYYMVNEREKEANSCISLALELHPDATDPQVFLARQQMFHGNLEEARRIAGGIPQQDDRETRFLWAEIYIKEGHPRKASHMLRDYYDTLSENRDIFLYDTACIFMDYDEWEIATQWAQRLKSEFPDFGQTDLLLSDILVSCGKVDEALPLLEGILDRDPFNKDAWKLTAEAQSAQEHYSEALESIDYLLAIDEHHNRGMAIRAHCLFRLGRAEEAHEQYTEALEQTPKDVSLLYFDAIALTAMEQFEEALGQLRMAKDLCTESQPDLPHILMHTAYVLSKLGQTDEALQYLEDAYKSTQAEYDTEYYLLKGHIMLEANDKITAARHFEQALYQADDMFSTMLTIAVEYSENAYYKEAIVLLRELIKSDMPDKEARCLPYLAYCLHYTPQFPDYKKYLHLAVEANPELTLFLFSYIYPGKTAEEYKNI